mgnify:CR=1 FL=1
MANKPKTRDNGAVSAFLGEFLTAGELIEAHPRTDDIITGVLEARTAGDTADCTLSRRVLFHVLQQCPAISVEHIAAVTVNPKTGYQYSGNSAGIPTTATGTDYFGGARQAQLGARFVF